MINPTSRLALLLLLTTTLAQAEPPTDPKARKIYDHNKEWLSKFPAPFIAANIRGQGNAYAERRQAALDLVKEKRDFGVVSELINELQKKSFLSSQIIDILADWKARRAIPALKEIEADDQRPAEVREKAKKAVETISNAPVDKPPVF